MSEKTSSYTPPLETRRLPFEKADILSQGSVLQDRYEIIRVLGIGGMGAVYQARDLRFSNVSRLCAVKEMFSTAVDPRMRQLALDNFSREANILAALNHPSIPKIFDFFSEGQRVYLVLEFVDGHDLEAIIESSPDFLEEGLVAEWAVQICDVLDYLHSQKPNPVIFRDLKPSNIMVTPQNWVMLVDFGIAKVFQVGEKGTMIGTEGYSPPEQYRGVAGLRGDLYALGATLHHLLTKRDPRLEPPFTFHERPPRQINPALSEGIEAIIMKALEYEPGNRFSSAAEMKAAILSLNSGKRPSVRAATATFNREREEITPIWEFRCEDEVRSSPRIYKELLYCGAYDNNVYALNARSGQLVWKYPAEGGISASPTIWDDYVYIGSEDNVFYCLRADTGRIVWTKPTRGRIRSSARVALAHVFFGSDDGYLYAVHAQSGREVWKFAGSGPIRSSPSVERDFVFFGSNDGYFYALDIQNGRVQWRFRTNRAIVSSPALADNLVIFGSNDWNIYALEQGTGFNVWRRRTNQAVIASPTIANDRVYIGSADRNMYCLDARTGRVIWKFTAEGQITSTAAVTEEAVYFGCSDNYVYKIDPKNGELIWRFDTGGPVPSSPLVTKEMLYVGSTDHKIYALPL